jgi:hypothetical protein
MALGCKHSDKWAACLEGTAVPIEGPQWVIRNSQEFRD